MGEVVRQDHGQPDRCLRRGGVCGVPSKRARRQLDALARILDLPARWPVAPDNFEKVEVIGNPIMRSRHEGPRLSGSPWQMKQFR